MSQSEPGYFGTVVRALRSITDGLAVTMSYVFRAPITVQYPDRTPVPVPDTLPERYRGLLEVDMETCGACKACERDCPIGCIRIDMTKEKGADGKPKLIMTRFDIDMSKCMFCGLCVEACGTSCQCEGDTEPSKAIHFTREFEGVAEHPAQLVYRFIRPGDRIQAAKSLKETVPARRRGQALREARRHAQVYNALAFAWALDHEQHQDDETVAGAAPAAKADDK
jgi:formate hydrogenlyase subunit 6/NADH:ubiquinone oxidoreductase subunit I